MSKHGKNHPPTHAKNTEGEEKSTKRHVWIEPPVQIDIVKNLKEQHETERTEDTAAQKKQLFWTKVAAALVFIYTFVSGCQLKIAHDVFVAANRPSVGVNAISVVHHGQDKEGKMISSQNRTPETVNMAITAEIKNFGTVAAENFEATWDGYVNGVKQPPEGSGTPPRIMFPGRVVSLIGKIGSKTYPDIMNGKSILEVHVTVRYDGPKQKYAYCEIDRYSPFENAFTGVGSCPVTEP